MLGIRVCFIALGLAAGTSIFAAPAPSPAPDYAKDVAPILQQRCAMCHNAQLKQNGVRVDDPAALMAGGYSGPVIVPGKSADSKLMAKITSDKPGFKMPPMGEPLRPAEIAIIRSWIDSGAKLPAATAKAGTPTATKSSHWAFQPVRRPEAPDVKDASWARNPIDRFILARLEKEGIAPSPEASKEVLLRRVSFDLTGLPPTPDETRAFVADTRADAYERLVDRLLESPHYGEQRARFWLDLARYADSDGYEKDQVRPWAWRWRNWVINAFNRDMPYDQFTIQQLAGDLLPNAGVEEKVATGFHRNTLTNREAGVDRAEARFEQIINRTGTTGVVWLGMTVGCAQCHDHKYDPISQKEFYQLSAFFNNGDERTIDAPLPGELGTYLRALPDYRAKRDALYREYNVAGVQRQWEEKVRGAMDQPGKNIEWDFSLTSMKAMFDGAERVLRTPEAQRSERDREALTDYFIRNPGPESYRKQPEVAKLKELVPKVNELQSKLPRYSQASILQDLPEPVQTFIAVRGDYRNHGLEVQPGTLAVLPPLPEGPKNRLTLAKWIVSRDNPLTARVEVNRMWQQMFGRGLVLTSEDFGKMGDKPTHPELMDWLASEFMDRGWSEKQMLRTIVTSATYRQSSNTRKDLADKDPENTLLARQSRVRLPAEQIRDAALTASGLLNLEVGGPSVRPPQPKGVAELGYGNSVKWNEDQGPARYRRGLYVHYQRTTPYPMLSNFDEPDSNLTCTRRRRSNSPLQALNLMNDPVFFEAAQALAYRLSTETAGNAGARVDQAFQFALGRMPTQTERQRLLQFLDDQASRLNQNPKAAAQVAPVDPLAAAWVSVSRVLLNLDEFMTRE